MKHKILLASAAMLLAGLAAPAPARALEPCDDPAHFDQVFVEYRKYTSPDGAVVETVMYVEVYDDRSRTFCFGQEIIIGVTNVADQIRKPTAEILPPPEPAAKPEIVTKSAAPTKK